MQQPAEFKSAIGEREKPDNFAVDLPETALPFETRFPDADHDSADFLGGFRDVQLEKTDFRTVLGNVGNGRHDIVVVALER